MKTDKYFNATYSLIIGVSLTFLGIIMLVFKSSLYINVVNIFIVALFFLSIKQLIDYFIGKEKSKKANFLKSVINIILCLVFSFFKGIPLSILPIMFGIFLALNSLIKFINGYLFFKDRNPGYLTDFVFGLLYLVFGLILIFSPIKNLDIVLIIIGTYILLLGITYIFDAIDFVLPKKYKHSLRRHIRISLPVIIEAILPYAVLREINYNLDKDTYDDDFVFEEKSEDVEPDIELLVHMSNNGFNRTGHLDIHYNGQIISYGSYEELKLKFFKMIGDGVLFTTTKDKYIPFCIEHSKKTLCVFGLKLTDKQKQAIDKTIADLKKDLIPWDPPYKEALNNKDNSKKKKKVKKSDYKDYASCLYKATNANFYKFKKGKFKRYFVVGNNCSKLVDHIVGKSGIDILKFYGIVTPGAYYEYLNREFQKKNSMVISRKIYNKKNVDKKTIKEIFRGFSQ